MKTPTINAVGLLSVCGLALAASLTGCGKSFMDPTKLGRFKDTPTIMPILDRIASVEDDTGQVVEYSDPLREDLIPQPESYRIGPGDVLRVIAYDVVVIGQREEYEVPVDARGVIEIPQLGRISVAGRTTEEAMAEIVAAIRAKGLVQDPLVQVLAMSQRQQTYTVLGAVQNPGLYPIPRADYRLLEALASAGNFDETTKEVYIIRQVPLSEEVSGAVPGLNNNRPLAPLEGAPSQPAEQPQGQDLIDIIDQIAPETKDQTTPPAEPKSEPKSAPGMFGRQDGQPAEPPAKPLIDLIEEDSPSPGAPAGDGASWVFLNGKWVKVKAPTMQEALSIRAKPDELITQRVIRVPMKQLLQGYQTVNIVIRPGDVVRFPATSSGFVYMGGEIARPGPYQVAPDFTLLRAIDSAGGLGELGIPSRVELTRMLPGNRQAVIKLDLQAISEHTQPDIYLKPSDRVTIGTTWWALPLAVTRNGFRASYGFGFILDRNISSDLFGPPPTNQFGQ
jgi:polysaccharide export outer membrane protein